MLSSGCICEVSSVCEYVIIYSQWFFLFQSRKHPTQINGTENSQASSGDEKEASHWEHHSLRLSQGEQGRGGKDACVCTTKNTGVALSDRMGFVWCKHAYVQPRTGVALSVKMGFAQTLKKNGKRFLFPYLESLGKLTFLCLQCWGIS